MSETLFKGRAADARREPVSFKDCLVRNSKAFADVLRILELVENGDGEILECDPTLTFRVHDEAIVCRPIFSGAIARHDDIGWAQARPIETLCFRAPDRERLDALERFRSIDVRERSRTSSSRTRKRPATLNPRGLTDRRRGSTRCRKTRHRERPILSRAGQGSSPTRTSRPAMERRAEEDRSENAPSVTTSRSWRLPPARGRRDRLRAHDRAEAGGDAHDENAPISRS